MPVVPVDSGLDGRPRRIVAVPVLYLNPPFLAVLADLWLRYSQLISDTPEMRTFESPLPHQLRKTRKNSADLGWTTTGCPPMVHQPLMMCGLRGLSRRASLLR
jgi:hypothetical protein